MQDVVDVCHPRMEECTVEPLLTHTPWWMARAMGYGGLWVMRGMGYEGVDCIRYLSLSTIWHSEWTAFAQTSILF